MILDLDEKLQARYRQLMPIGRLTRIQEIADAITYLLSNEASYVNATVLEVDGGYMQAGPN